MYVLISALPKSIALDGCLEYIYDKIRKYVNHFHLELSSFDSKGVIIGCSTKPKLAF